MDLSFWKAGLLMLGVGVIAVGGGTVLTEVLANEAAAAVFGWIGAAWLLTGFIGLAVLHRPSKKNVSAYLYLSVLTVNMGCTSLCFAISIPLLFAYSPSSLIGQILIGYFSILTIYQLRQSNHHITYCWEMNHPEALKKCFDPVLGTLNVEKFIDKLHIEVQLHLPVQSRLLRDLIYLVLIIAMLVGINL